jgi:hypothetical protein
MLCLLKNIIMKNLIRIVSIFLFSTQLLTNGSAQDLQYPNLSYDATIREKVGFTNLKIVYGRPMQRGRELFGGFIPYDQRWRAGANGTTRISFDTPVWIAGKEVQPGTYALLLVPTKNDWEVILHQDTAMFWRRRDYLTSEEVAHFPVKPLKSAFHQEAMTIFTDIENHNAVINLLWDQTHIKFTIDTKTTPTVVKNIREQYKSGQLDTVDELLGAADFIAFNCALLPASLKDTALMMVNKAIELDPQGNHYHAKRNIYWFSKDLKGVEKTTAEWIAFYERRKGENDVQHIAELKAELERHRRILGKK